MVPATKFLPLSSTEVASDVAAADEDPSDTDDDKDSVGDGNDAYEDPSDTDEDLVGDGGWFLPLSSTELACDVAATDEDPSDTDDDKDSVGDGNNAYEDPS